MEVDTDDPVTAETPSQHSDAVDGATQSQPEISESPTEPVEAEPEDDVVIVDAEGVATEKEKVNGLPLARIKALVNADEDVGMVSKAAVTLIARATELFIAQISSDAARHISSTKRKTIQLNDIVAVTEMCDEYAFLDGITLSDSTNKPSKKATTTAKTTSKTTTTTAESTTPEVDEADEEGEEVEEGEEGDLDAEVAAAEDDDDGEGEDVVQNEAVVVS